MENITAIQVPRPILLDRSVRDTARFLWMILRLGAPGEQAPPGKLEMQSGLARHTVLRGLARLHSAGWPTNILSLDQPDHSRNRADWLVAMPRDLLLDRQIDISPKLLYGALQLTPGFQTPTGQSTYGELCDLSGMSLNTIKRALQTLHSSGWITRSQKNQFHPLHFSLRNPAVERRHGAVAAARQRLKEANFKGEALMREYLSLIINRADHKDNFSPDFLINPMTGMPMQFDRYYPDLVAFEFNGDQHYGATEKYSSEEQARNQQGRDLMKHGICAKRGVALVVIHAQDLSLDGMRKKAASLLPLRELEDHALLIDYLASVSREYQENCP